MAVDAFGNVVPGTVPGTGPLPALLPAATVGENKIDPALRPYLEQGLQRAQQLFFGAQPTLYSGQMYVSPSAQTLDALTRQENIAKATTQPILTQAQSAYLSGLGATSAAQPLFQSVYSEAATRPGVNVYESAAAGSLAPSTTRLEQLYGAAGAQPYSSLYGQVAGGQFQNLALPGTAQTAAGSFLMGSPYQQAMMEAATRPLTQQFMQNVLPGISSQYSLAGRYGSGAMQRAQGQATESFTRALGDVTSGIAGQEYARERGFQEAARQQLGQLSQQELMNRLAGAGAAESALRGGIQQQAGIAGQLSGLQQQAAATRLAGAAGLQQAEQMGLAAQLQAAGGVASSQEQQLQRQLAAAQAAPGMFNMQLLPSQVLAQVGQSREAIAAQPLQEAIQRHQFSQQLPYSQLQSYLSSIYGTPMASSVYPQQQMYQNPTMNTLAGAGLGYVGGQALGSFIGGTPFSLTSPSGYGLAGGALGGLLGGGFF